MLKYELIVEKEAFSIIYSLQTLKECKRKNSLTHSVQIKHDS